MWWRDRPARDATAGGGTCAPSSRPAPIHGPDQCPQTGASPPILTAPLPPPGPIARAAATESGCATSFPSPRSGGRRRRHVDWGRTVRSPRTARATALPCPSRPGTRRGASSCGGLRNPHPTVWPSSAAEVSVMLGGGRLRFDSGAKTRVFPAQEDVAEKLKIVVRHRNLLLCARQRTLPTSFSRSTRCSPRLRNRGVPPPTG